MNEGSFKDLEEVSLKATYNIELGNQIIQAGEVLAYFDQIQIAGLQEVKSFVSANGGYGNRGHVFWETTKEIDLNFSRGIFSKEQFALLTNSKLIDTPTNENIVVRAREILESDQNGVIQCKNIPISPTFVYDYSTGEKLNFIQQDKTLTITKPYMDVIVDYEYNYTNGAASVQLGNRLLNGFLSLEGKTRVKDDTTGHIITGLIKIPKLKLMSNLSIRLGAQASPVVANFSAVGIPVGSRSSSYVVEFCYLHDDITSDL